MAYGRYNRRRRFRYRRRRRTPSKATIYSRKSARSQAKQIYSLSRAIRRHDIKLKDRAQYVQYKVTFGSNGITHGFTPSSEWQPVIKKMISPNGNWTPVFQTPTLAGNDKSNKFRGRSIGAEHLFQMENPTGTEGDPVTCTLFCVTLRKEAAQQFMNDTSQGTILIPNQHYTITSLGVLQGAGMIFLNKGIFKIRYCKRFIISANIDFEADQKVTNVRDGNLRIYHKLSYPNVIKSTNGVKGYKQLNESEIEDTDQVFYYLFHNAYEAQAIAWHMNAIITGRQTN